MAADSVYGSDHRNSGNARCRGTNFRDALVHAMDIVVFVGFLMRRKGALMLRFNQTSNLQKWNVGGKKSWTDPPKRHTSEILVRSFDPQKARREVQSAGLGWWNPSKVNSPHQNHQTPSFC